MGPLGHCLTRWNTQMCMGKLTTGMTDVQVLRHSSRELPSGFGTVPPVSQRRSKKLRASVIQG
jgi:hypothetical protein